jgi:uncharacterized protein YlxW (UPF0749 family)
LKYKALIPKIVYSLKSQRSLEQDKYDKILESLTRYEKLRKDFEDEIRSLQKKNFNLQQEVIMKDEVIQKLQIVNKQLQSQSNITCIIL